MLSHQSLVPDRCKYVASVSITRRELYELSVNSLQGAGRGAGIQQLLLLRYSWHCENMNIRWHQTLLLLLISQANTLLCCAQPKTALLVIDMQGCFLPGGPVAVSGEVGPVVAATNSLRAAGGFELVVWTQDWHPPNHVSFAPVHGRQPQDKLTLSYTCVGNRWLGKGPRLCNMTHLYPGPEESVTCVCHQADSGCASGGSLDGSHAGRTCSVSAADGSSSDSSLVDSTPDRPGQAATSTTHGLTAAAAALAERIRALGCPEPVTEVQQVLWPPHCVQYTAGARLHRDLHVGVGDLIVRKGWQPFIDAYSAFEDNGKLQSTGLAARLRQDDISRVVLTGVALDYCVLWTALDAVTEGFKTVVALDATLPVSVAGAADAVQQLRSAGVQVVDKAQYLQAVTVTQ